LGWSFDVKLDVFISRLAQQVIKERAWMQKRLLLEKTI
jgi:hypothetical protein